MSDKQNDNAIEEDMVVEFRDDVESYGGSFIHLITMVDARVGASAFRLYCLLRVHAQKKQTITGGLTRLTALHPDTSRRPTISGWMAQLEVAGWITRQRRVGMSSITILEPLREAFDARHIESHRALLAAAALWGDVDISSLYAQADDGGTPRGTTTVRPGVRKDIKDKKKKKASAAAPPRRRPKNWNDPLVLELAKHTTVGVRTPKTIALLTRAAKAATKAGLVPVDIGVLRRIWDALGWREDMRHPSALVQWGGWLDDQQMLALVGVNPTTAADLPPEKRTAPVSE